MVRQKRLELLTKGLEDLCSIHLSYYRIMAEVTGFEPVNAGVKVLSLTTWLNLYDCEID